MSIRYSIIYNRRNKLNANGKALIQLLIYFNRHERKYISTGIYIEPKYWNKDKGIISARHPKSVSYNAEIRKMISDIERYQIQLMGQNMKLTPHRLETFLKSGLHETFTEFCDIELERTLDLSQTTKRTQKASLNKLREFNGNIYFSDITYSLIAEFDRFLKEKGLKINTVAKVHTHIKKFINLAIKKDYLQVDQNPYKKFKVKRERTVRPWLKMSELKKIEDINYDNNPGLDRLKDLFLFACYTGLRFSDVIQLDRTYIRRNEKGEWIIELHRMRKVDQEVYLPLTKLFEGRPAQLVDKYYELFPDHEYLFGKPVSNQHLNRELKFIARHAGLKMELTSHVARHTFGSILASVKPDPYLIMELMGHSKLSTSMIYIHGSRERIDNQLDDVEW